MAHGSITELHPSINPELLSLRKEDIAAAFVSCGDLSIDGNGYVWRHRRKVANTGRTVEIVPPARVDISLDTGRRIVKVNVLGNRIVCYAARLVWVAKNGPILDGYDIHHVNGDPTDNRIENLTALSKSQHQREHKKDPENEKEAHRLRNSGVSIRKIAEALGVSITTAAVKADKHAEECGIPAERLARFKRKEAREAYDLYMYFQDIRKVAALQGCTFSSVSQKIQRYCGDNDVPYPIGKHAKETSQEAMLRALRMYEGGMLLREIAEIEGVRESCISRRVSKARRLDPTHHTL